MKDKDESDTLLAHLAWKLSTRHEDIAVEALGYILRRTVAREVLEELFREGGADVGPICGFRTQVGGDGETRPDLTGFDQQGVSCVLIEAKFWAGLTRNQPNAYLKELSTGKALLFVAPSSRIEVLWPELRRRAGVGSTRHALEKTDFKGITTEDRKHLMLISWPNLLDRLESKSETPARVEIQQLRGFARRADEETGFPPLRPKELTPETPRRLLGLRRLVDDATTKAVEKGYAHIDGLIVTPQKWGYGRYLYLNGTGGAWFGIDIERWARGSFSDTPLWLHFEQWKNEPYRAQWPGTRCALESLLCGRDPPGYFVEGDKIYIPIVLPAGVEYEAVLDTVVDRLRVIAHPIPSEGPAEAQL